MKFNKIIGKSKGVHEYLEQEILLVSHDLSKLWFSIVIKMNSRLLELYITSASDRNEYLLNEKKAIHYINKFLNTGTYGFLEKIITLCNVESSIKNSITDNLDDNVTLISKGIDYYLNNIVSDIRNDIDVNDFFDIYVNDFDSASCCFIVEYNTIPKILLSSKETNNFLLIAHEVGHCIHFYLAMKNQHFYAFETSVYVRESIAFMFEALVLVFLCTWCDMADRNKIIKNYINESKYYFNINDELSPILDNSYRKYYPLSRIVGESLAIKIIKGEITPEYVKEYLCSGGHLTIEKLLKLSEV